MEINLLSLNRQVDFVFKEIYDELVCLQSGIVFIHIRNNVIGKFGVKHDPIESKDELFTSRSVRKMSETQFTTFRKKAIESLRFKKGWTHGIIMYEFGLQNEKIAISMEIESHYNLANVLSRKSSRVAISNHGA